MNWYNLRPFLVHFYPTFPLRRSDGLYIIPLLLLHVILTATLRVRLVWEIAQGHPTNLMAE